MTNLFPSGSSMHQFGLELQVESNFSNDKEHLLISSNIARYLLLYVDYARGAEEK